MRSNWLTRYMNELAGKPLSEGPLTFGDLYTAPRPPDDPEPDGPDYKAINLEMMTCGYQELDSPTGEAPFG